MNNLLGNKIRSWRHKQGLTMGQLSLRAGVCRSFIRDAENGVTQHRAGKNLLKLARALNVTVDFLLDESRSEMALVEGRDVLFRRYQKLPPEKKEIIISLLDRWEESRE